MNCKKCHKEIPDGSPFCNWCGKKQVTQKRKVHQRANGTGSIQIDKRCKNYPYIVRSPATAAGAGRKYIGSYKTMIEAQAALDDYFRSIHSDMHNFTVEKLYSAWSAKHYETLTTSGAQGYKTAWKYLDTIAGRKIKELKTADYQLCIDKCAEKFSRSQCEKVKQLCSQLCKFAMQNDIIDKNYAEFVKLPKAEKKEKQIFTDDEIKKLWQHSDDERVKIILFMIYTGFRIGEIFKIRCDNVHVEENYIIGGSKTEAGTDRIVPIVIPQIQEFVRNWLYNSNKDYLIDGDKDNFRKRSFYPALSDCGIIPPPTIKKDKKGKEVLVYDTRLTPHCTRHTFATLSVNAGLAPENLQKIIGHSKFETTANIYVHEDVEKLKDDMQKLNDQLSTA